jgi:type IX secretion system PorP/SprF family membrane protein
MSGMNLAKKPAVILLLIIFFASLKISVGQQVPLTPISYRVFSPFLFNPAIAGSKDFPSLDLIVANQGKLNAQVLSANARIVKKGPSYFLSPKLNEFTNIGIGGSVFNEVTSEYENTGASFTLSYQIPLDKQRLSYLSFGASIKGVYNTMDSILSTDPGLSRPSKTTFYVNPDFGIYYYRPSFFAGISSTNLLGSPKKADSLGLGGIPVTRQYYFQAGYKILISRSYNIVLEPSLIINANDSSTFKTSDILKPMLKVYLDNFCAGTYFNDFNNYSVFFQFKYPRFSIGAFFQLPKNSPYFKKELTAEFMLGINLSKNSPRNHW